MTRRQPTKEELALWRQVASGVRPLKSSRHRKRPIAVDASATVRADQPRKPPKAKSAAPAHAMAVVQAPTPTAIARPALLEHGAATGIDRRQAERFRKGKLTIDGRLDLHGHTQIEAHDMLLGFLKRMHGQGKRCVLVITGKGMTAGKGGVLRQSVPRWLNEPGFRQMVLAFDHAAVKDGGEGALYVLLKRLK